MIKRLSVLVVLAAVALLTAPLLTGYTFQTSAWPSGSTVPLYLGLGAAPSTLLDGARSWDDVAASAVSIWDRQLVSIDFISRIQGRTPGETDGFNDVFFADDVFGDALAPTTLAATNIWYRGESTRIEANIIFNRAKTWNSYRGPLRSGVIDFRRVALHAFGHVLGLAHPDLAGQNVAAIMNSTAHETGGTVDDLQEDDIQGARALYGSAPQPGPAIVSTPRADRVAFRRTMETLYRNQGASTRRTYVDVDGIGIWSAEYYWYRVSYCDHATAIARVFAQIEGRGVQPVCAEPASMNLAANLDDSDAFRAALEIEYRDVLRTSPIDSYLSADADSIWMKVYTENRFKGMNHAQATANITDKFAAPAPTPAPAPRPSPTPTPAPGAPRTAEAYCSSLPRIAGQSGNWFYCGTVQGNLQAQLPNNWPGYCALTQMNLGLVGYSATTFAGGADLVRDYSGAQEMCNAFNTGGLRQCASIIQCTRQ
jgi:hypothetical protein